MPNYRRAFIPGGTWFFTANLLQRHDNDLLIREINLLRETVRRVRKRHPFQIDAWVVLPEHLHSTAGMQEVGQRWEHFIRNDVDFQRHVDYVHVNPLKHGYVKRVADWPYSTFHRYVAKGIYPVDRYGDINSVVVGDE